MTIPNYKALTLTLPNSALPTLTIYRGEGNWVKRSTVRSGLGERTVVGIPIYSGGSDPYFRYEVACWLMGRDEPMLFEEMVQRSRDRYDALQDGRIELSDFYQEVSQSQWNINSRQVISGTSRNTAFGSQAAYCRMPVFVSPSDDAIAYDGNTFWPLSFSMEELP